LAIDYQIKCCVLLNAKDFRMYRLSIMKIALGLYYLYVYRHQLVPRTSRLKETLFVGGPYDTIFTLRVAERLISLY